MPSFGVIFASGKNGEFAKDGKLPWKCPEDIEYFRQVTVDCTVVMGSKTYLSIGRPLPHRRNIIMSRSEVKDIYPNQCDSFESLFKMLEEDEKVWIIGGIDLIMSFCREHFYKIDVFSNSIISGDYSLADQKIDFFDPIIQPFFNLSRIDIGLSTDAYVRYFSKDSYKGGDPESLDYMYLSILKDLLYNNPRQTRNAKTRSSFGETLRIKDIHSNFPILKTKRIYWKGVVEELLFFLSGMTDTNELSQRRVNIWNANTNKDFLTRIRKEDIYPEGDMGPMYGFQLRHFNASYLNCNSEYDGKGIDQVRNVIELLVNDPNSRRIVMTTYNPAQAEDGVLYPCHGLVTQFYASPEEGKISLATYQRSADWFLGVPFNISSYGLLLYIIVQEVNELNSLKDPPSPKYIPGDLILNFGDIHLYTSHLVPALEQLRRMDKSDKSVKLEMPPVLGLLSKTGKEFWEMFSYKDFVLHDYNPQTSIKAEMIA